MSDPEIDRRCSICGASARARATFCPQCGQPFKDQDTNPKPSRDVAVANSSAEKLDPIGLAGEGDSDGSETRPLIAAPDLSQTQPLISVAAAASEPPLAQKHPGMQRATELARGIEENVIGKVEKLRRVSSVVIDQAAYDPSLRFLLVAAGLFLLFLFLLLFSKVLG